MPRSEDQAGSLERRAADARAAFERETDRYRALADWARPQIKARYRAGFRCST